jgi:hypothetical protein
MKREEEIKILIDYLKNDVLNTSSFPNLLLDTIVNNGKLIESYKIELEKIKEKGL